MVDALEIEATIGFAAAARYANEAALSFERFAEAVSKATAEFIRIDLYLAQAIKSRNDLRSFRRQLRLRRARKNWRGNKYNKIDIKC